MHRPVSIAQKLARKKHQIGMPLLYNAVGLRWIGNKPNRGGCNPSLAPDSCSKLHLVARTNRNRNPRHHAAR